MVSWDMEVKFLGLSPHIKELQILAKKERFSNIESMEFINTNRDCESTYRLIVNNRGLEQTKFKAEKIGVV